MAEDFFSTMASYSEAPLKERVEGLADVTEKMMTIIMKLPDMFDGSLNAMMTKINALESKVSGLEAKIAAGVSMGGGGGSPGAPPSPGGPPRMGGGAPPPPPSGGAGPPPPPSAGGGAPAGPVSLRGSIMGELKDLFAKRRKASEE